MQLMLQRNHKLSMYIEFQESIHANILISPVPETSTEKKKKIAESKLCSSTVQILHKTRLLGIKKRYFFNFYNDIFYANTVLLRILRMKKFRT